MDAFCPSHHSSPGTMNTKLFHYLSLAFYVVSLTAANANLCGTTGCIFQIPHRDRNEHEDEDNDSKGVDEDIEDKDEDREEEEEESMEEGGGLRVFFFCVAASGVVRFSALKWFTVQTSRYSITNV